MRADDRGDRRGGRAARPAGSRGEATGLQSSAFTLGAAAGAPVVGFVVDHGSPAWGFAAAGAGGLLVAVVAFALARTRPAPLSAPAEAAA
ncbi:MFS transporter [Actinokineospora soli]|uniref:MFS transporter n=1 Tax=Actinokineospora soli TaxID=1048753 RepID=A0ABW2TXJ8_9PSEU